MAGDGLRSRMNCRSVKEAVFLFTDNEMEEDVVVSFREHLALCPSCERYLRQKKVVLTQIRRCRRAAAPKRLRVRILTSLPHRR